MENEKREYKIGRTTYVEITHYNTSGVTLAELIKRLVSK